MEIYKARIPLDIKKEALALSSEIEAHELYFSSFSDKSSRCDEIRKHYSSEEGFLYEVYEKATISKNPFLYICGDNRGKPIIVSDIDYTELYPRYEPLLAVDLCEHSYFLDYGFEREEYLRSAIAHLDLSKLVKTANKDVTSS